MTLEVRNKFIEGLLKKAGGEKDNDYIHSGLGFRFGPALQSTHLACYSSFDSECKKANLPFWFHPTNADSPVDQSITDREEYAFWAITHPESPWQPWLDAMPEQFEGYDTPEDRAALIARVGLVYGPKAWETLTKIEMGCFAVFHRVAYEHNGVRASLKKFLGDKRTASLPLRWNVFAAHHIRSNRHGIEEAWGNWHTNFNAAGIPNLAVCYVKTEYKPIPQKSCAFGGAATTFMGGNSDRLFHVPTIRGPDEFVAKEADRFGPDFEERAAFKDAVTTNLWYWNKKVKPYV